MTIDTLVFLRSQDADDLLLKRLNGVGLSKQGDVAVLHCHLLSDEGPYLRVNVSFSAKKTGKQSPLLLLIPHSSVLLVMKTITEASLLGFAQHITQRKPTA